MIEVLTSPKEDEGGADLSLVSTRDGIVRASSRRRRPSRSRMCGAETVASWTSASPSVTYQERTACASASRFSPHRGRRASPFTICPSADRDCAAHRTRAAPATNVATLSTFALRGREGRRRGRPQGVPVEGERDPRGREVHARHREGRAGRAGGPGRVARAGCGRAGLGPSLGREIDTTAEVNIRFVADES